MISLLVCSPREKLILDINNKIDTSKKGQPKERFLKKPRSKIYKQVGRKYYTSNILL